MSLFTTKDLTVTKATIAVTHTESKVEFFIDMNNHIIWHLFAISLKIEIKDSTRPENTALKYAKLAKRWLEGTIENIVYLSYK